MLSTSMPPGDASSAKASTPRAEAVIQRERLFRLLESDGARRITWIHAPAGFGKTTLAASFLEARQVHHLWYRFDAGDGDLAAFLEQLTRQFIAIVGTRPLAEQPLPVPGPPGGQALIPFCRPFFRELFSRVSTPFAWVFDEVDVLPLDAMTLAALAIACEEVPAGSRLILIGRNPPMAALARLEVNGTLGRIGPQELSFNQEETAALLAREGQPVSPERVAAIHERTRGWVAAIRLTPREEPGVSIDSPVLAGDQHRLLASYFESEVLVSVAQGLQDELMTLAVADSVTSDLIDSLTGSGPLHALLERLADDKLFVDRLTGPKPAFRLHPLFRTFLLDRMRRLWPSERIRALQQRAAEQLAAGERPDEAVALLRDAGDYESLRRMIRHHGPVLNAHGQFVRLGDWLAMLPADVRDADPWMIYWDGTGRLYTEPAAAKARLAAAHRAFEASGDAAGVVLSWSGYVEAVFNEYAVLSQLDPWLDRFDERIAPLLARLAPDVAGRVMVTRFMALVFRRPDDPALPALTGQVAQIADRVDDPSVGALIRCQLFLHALWRGDLAGARIELATLQELAHRPDATALTQLFALLNAATLHLFVGELPDCETSVGQALAVAERSGLRLWDAVLHGHRISALLAQGKHEQAEACLPALRRSQVHDRHSEISRYFGLAGWFAARRPARDDAIHYLDRSQREADLGGIPMFQAIARLMIADARSRIDPGDPMIDSALSQALATGLRIGNPMLQWIAETAQVGHRGRVDGAAVPLEAITRAFALGAKNDYRHFICWPATMVGRACELALQHGIQRDYAQRLIQFNRIAPSATGAVLDDWPWPVRIRTLGRFSILVNGQPPPSGRKLQKVPLRLLQYLVAAGGQKIREDAVCDALWPESDGDKASENLAASLHRLRQLLQVDCVERKGGQLSLDTSQVWTDVSALQRAMRDEQAAALTPARILTLYQGQFLDHEDDPPWAIPPRRRLQDELGTYIGRQIAAMLRSRRFEDAEAWCRCGLAIDDENERYYRGVMRCRLAAGDAAGVVQFYRRCEAMLQSRLGLVPSGKTRELYLQAVGPIGPIGT